MTNRTFTTVGEVASYLVVLYLIYFGASFWYGFIFPYMIKTFGIDSLVWVSFLSSAVFMFLSLAVFFPVRNVLAPKIAAEQQAGRFAAAPEAGAFLMARLLSTILAQPGIFLLNQYLFQHKDATVAGLPARAVLFQAYSVLVMVVALLLFLCIRRFLPRLCRVCFTFAGRISRAEYWGFLCAMYGIFGGTLLVSYFSGVVLGGDTGGAPAAWRAQWLSPLLLSYLVILWSSIAKGVKRCHDRNRSGWFFLVSFVPILNFWSGIEIGFLRGTIGSNRFGPDPVDGAPGGSVALDSLVPPPIRRA